MFQSYQNGRWQFRTRKSQLNCTQKVLKTKTNENCDFQLLWRKKDNMDFQYPQGIFLEKNNGPFKSVEFAQKCRCFSNQNVPQGDYMKIKFDNFQIQKLISQTDRAEK